MNKETVQIEEAGIKMPFGKNLLNQLRLLLSASTLFSSLLMIYSFSQGKVYNITLITIIIVLFSGIITGTISIEGIEKIIRNRSPGILVGIKNGILIGIWVVGLAWGALYIFLVLYVSFMTYFR